MDDRLQQLERDIRGGDGPALADYVRRLSQTAGPDAVEARVTALVDEAGLPAAAWIPALVEAACVDGYRRGRALVFEGEAKSKKKGREVEELQLDRHGASFGIRPADASIVAIDEASDRELTWPSDVSPALLLRLLRDRSRLELDLADDDAGARFRDECAGLALRAEDERLVCPAGALDLVLEPEPGVAAARLAALRRRDDDREHQFVPGVALPRRLFTGLDLQRVARRVADAAGSTYRSRADLAAFFEWIVQPDAPGVTVEVEPMAGSAVGARACYEAWVDFDDRGPLDEPRAVLVSGPVRATPAEVLEDLLVASTYTSSGEVVDGWSVTPLDDDVGPRRDAYGSDD